MCGDGGGNRNENVLHHAVCFEPSPFKSSSKRKDSPIEKEMEEEWMKSNQIQ